MDALNHSLDEIIRNKCRHGTPETHESAFHVEAMEVTPPNSNDAYKSLDEIIRERGIKRTAVETKTTAPIVGDVFKSLDEIVQERGIQVGASSSRSSESKVKEDVPMQEVQSPGTLTAYRAVSFLSISGMIVEIVTGRLTDDQKDRSHLWRCIVKCGAIEGIADSVRKMVAREMASDNFLARLKETYSNVKIPKYCVLEETFIDPRLFHLIDKEAGKRALNVSHEVRVKPPAPGDGNRRGNSFYTFVCTYYVGQKKCKGENLIVENARLRAVREAYKLVTGKYPEPTKYFVGNDCDRSLEYKFSETEVHQTVEAVDDEEFPSNLDPQEARIENVRREVAGNFKRAKKDEDDQRRNMPVDVKAISGNRKA